MPAATMAWAAPAALGALGLYQQSQQSKKQADLQEKALKAGKFTEASQADMYKIAKDYDPVAEAEVAVNRANEVAGQNLSTGLSNLRGNFMQAGGDPAGDTEFNVRAQTETNRVLDPLRDFIAKVRSSATMQKIGAYQAVAGVPIGQLAQNYFQAAGQAAPDYTGPASLFAQAIRNIPQKSGGGGGGGGAGGTGDNSKTPTGRFGKGQ